jgi:uncharacterized protein (TIGR02246 family)
MKKNLFFLAALFSGITVFGQTTGFTAERFYALATVLTATQPQTKDEEAIRGLFTTMEKGWNTKSGETFSSIFAETHDYIVVNGFYFSKFSQKANASVHQSLFDGMYKTTDIQVKVDRVDFLRPDLAVVTAFAGQYPKDGALPKDPSAIMTVIVEKRKDSWQIISFHNHSLAEVFAMKQTPVPVNVMYASWYK